MKEKGISRRNFLKGITALGGFSIGGISGLELWPETVEAVQEEEWIIRVETMKAFADTIIPGPYSDPEGSVGGVEAGALEVLYDPYYGVKPFISMLARNLNRTSLWWYGKLFKDLDLGKRTSIVIYKDYTSLIKLVYEQAENLVKLTFYGAIINDVGTNYISFPGPSFGYHDYYFLDDEMRAEKETEDGNLP